MRIFYFLVLSICILSISNAALIYQDYGDYSPHANYEIRQDPRLTSALRTGKEANGRPLFLCTARLFNSIQPGKTWLGYGRCNVPYGGKEYIVSRFVIPSRTIFNRSYWFEDPKIPFTIGHDTNGTPLYVCQAMFRGGIQPGKTWPGYNHCNISYAGHEIITDDYRILASSESARSTHKHPNQGCRRDFHGNWFCDERQW
mgnify:CR=1 FL=1